MGVHFLITDSGSAKASVAESQLRSRLQQEGSAIMVGHHPQYVFLTELDTCDPDFARKCLSWMRQTQREIAQVVANTEMTLAESQNVMAEADLLLAGR